MTNLHQRHIMNISYDRLDGWEHFRRRIDPDIQSTDQQVSYTFRRQGADVLKWVHHRLIGEISGQCLA